MALGFTGTDFVPDDQGLIEVEEQEARLYDEVGDEIESRGQMLGNGSVIFEVKLA